MALVIKDRIKETTTTTGTGTYSLAGAETGFQGFSEIGDGNTCYYACTDGTNFEVGIGTFTASGSTLARTTILESSNSDAAVDWSAGSKDIFVTYPADKAVYKDASGNVSGVGTLNATNVVASNLMQANAITLTGSIGVSVNENIIFEGSTADNYETFFTATDPTADRTITLPDATGTVLLSDGDGSNLTNVQAASVNVTESADDNVTYNVLFSDTGGSGNVQMTPTQDDGGLTFNPGTNFLYSNNAQHSYLYINGTIYHTGDHDTYINFDTDDSIKFATGGTERLHLNSSGVQINNAFTLPTADGSANQVLTAAGDGTTSWAAASGGMSSLIDDTTPQLGGDLDVGTHRIETTESQMNFEVDSDASSTGYEGYYFYGGPTTNGYNRIWITGTETAFQQRVGSSTAYTAFIQNNNQYSVIINEHGGNHPAKITNWGNGSSAHLNIGVRHADAKVRFTDHTGNTLRYAFPNSTPSSGQVLTASDGSGTLSWADASGGGSDPDLYRDNASSATTPSATGSNAVSIGNNSVASGTDSLAIGAYSNATGFRGIAVGRYVYATSTGSNAFGVNAYSAEQDTVSLGNARAFGGSYASAMAVGNNSTSYGAGQGYSLSFGFLSKAHNANSIAIGRSATVTHDDSVALGRNAASSAANEITLGSTSHSVRVSSAYTLPSSDGTAGQVLSTDGNGNLSWVDP